MKKLLFSALALTLIFALAGWATETRVWTLGDANNILKDEANVMLYPSTINLYRGLVLGEVASGMDLYSIGAHYDMGEGKSVIGLYVSSIGWPRGAGAPDPDGDDATDNKLNLFYGRPFGDTQFGMALAFYQDSYKVDGDDANQTEESNMNLGIKLGLTLQEKLDLALGIMYGTWTNKGTDGKDATKPLSNMTIDLGGRYWYAFNDNVDFIPHLGFTYGMGGYEVPDNMEDKTTHMELDLGWGVNIRPVDRVLLLFDFGILYHTMKDEVTPDGGDATELTQTWIHLPYYRVGLEGYVTKWWDLRLGAVKIWDNATMFDPETPDPDVDYKYAMAQTNLYLGSGVHFGNLTVDAQLNPDFVLNGPNFVSGWDGNLAYMASIKYAWK